MATTAKFEMAVNVPVVVQSVQYIDVWPDKNGYGSQVSVKGVIDGQTQTIFLKGKAWANLKALRDAGVIDPYDKAIEKPADKVNVPVMVAAPVTLCRQQKPGERFPSLVVSVENGKSSHSANGANGKAKFENPIELGGPIPGLDDVPDELPPVEEAYESTVDPRLDKMFALYDVCIDHAMHVIAKHNLDPELAPSIAATLYIQAAKR